MLMGGPFRRVCVCVCVCMCVCVFVYFTNVQFERPSTVHEVATSCDFRAASWKLLNLEESLEGSLNLEGRLGGLINPMTLWKKSTFSIARY